MQILKNCSGKRLKKLGRNHSEQQLLVFLDVCFLSRSSRVELGNCPCFIKNLFFQILQQLLSSSRDNRRGGGKGEGYLEMAFAAAPETHPTFISNNDEIVRKVGKSSTSSSRLINLRFSFYDPGTNGTLIFLIFATELSLFDETNCFCLCTFFSILYSLLLFFSGKSASNAVGGKCSSCPIPNCTTAKGRVKGRLRHLPKKWNTLSKDNKEAVSNDLRKDLKKLLRNFTCKFLLCNCDLLYI